MADGEVKINTKIDNSGLDKGLKDMKSKLDNASKQIDAGSKKSKGFADNLKSINAGAVATAGAGSILKSRAAKIGLARLRRSVSRTEKRRGGAADRRQK